MIRALLIEDSRLARLELREQLKSFSQIEILAEANNIDDGQTLIEQLQPELLFLDIDLCGESAFTLLAKLAIVPKIIFTTAFAEFALSAFAYHTVDYLLKPVDNLQLGRAIAKMSQQPASEMAARQTVSNPAAPACTPLTRDHQFFIKDGEQCYLVPIPQVRLFEATGNYSRVYFAENRPLLYKALSLIEERLDPAIFFRASRTHLVNLHYVSQVQPWVTGGLMLTLKCGTEVEVSRRQAAKFKQQLAL